MIPLTLFVLLFIALGLCFASNRDIFSPGKFYHGYLVVFFADIFLSDHHADVYGVYLGFVLVGMIISLVEAYTLFGRRVPLEFPTPCQRIPSRFVYVLWGLSVIPILAQCYLIHITGGLAFLTLTIVHRVEEWRGLGPLVTLIILISPINLVYFTVGLIYAKRRPWLWWSVYLLHLIVFFVTASLLGGRSFVLMQVMLMMMMYSYLRRPIKLRYVVLTGGVLLVIAAFLGAVRENLGRIQSLDDLDNMRGDTLNLKMLSYGTQPLELVFSREFDNLQYGKTLLTVVTNFVPRKIWAEKFDPGRIILTKFRDGREFTGLTHMSTGIIAEGIINFGYAPGVAWGFLFLFVSVLLTVQFYKNIVCHIRHFKGLDLAFRVILYTCIAQIPGTLLFGEFTKVFTGVVIRSVMCFGVIVILRLRLIPYRSRADREALYHDF